MGIIQGTVNKALGATTAGVIGTKAFLKNKKKEKSKAIDKKVNTLNKQLKSWEINRNRRMADEKTQKIDKLKRKNVRLQGVKNRLLDIMIGGKSNGER